MNIAQTKAHVSAVGNFSYIFSMPYFSSCLSFIFITCCQRYATLLLSLRQTISSNVSWKSSKSNAFYFCHLLYRHWFLWFDGEVGILNLINDNFFCRFNCIEGYFVYLHSHNYLHLQSMYKIITIISRYTGWTIPNWILKICTNLNGLSNENLLGFKSLYIFNFLDWLIFEQIFATR